MSEDSSVSESMAFKEYAHGRSKKLGLPWLVIILTGLGVALAQVLTWLFAAIVLENPWALNFIISLYGIPAGFICAWKNDNFTALTSLQYSSLSALVSIGGFFVFSFIMK